MVLPEPENDCNLSVEKNMEESFFLYIHRVPTILRPRGALGRHKGVPSDTFWRENVRVTRMASVFTDFHLVKDLFCFFFHL